jgi:ADP-ribosylglycohydrolase
MQVTLDVGIDVRNYLHLFREQGLSVQQLWDHCNRLMHELEPAARAGSPDWRELEARILALDESTVDGPDEPADLPAILGCRPGDRRDRLPLTLDDAALADRIAGAWWGRIAGCVLGKPVEMLMQTGDSRNQLRGLLQQAGEYPLNDYITEAAVAPFWQKQADKPHWLQEWRTSLRGHITAAPADDDLNYTVIALELIERHGRSFTPDHVLDHWLRTLPYGVVWSAEKMAYRNRVLGLAHPQTARLLNPYRQWIGAQIRTDLYGYIAPGQPQHAAELAWADAAASHTANGIYGGMWVAATVAAAFCALDADAAIRRGLEQIPARCRLATELRNTLDVAHHHGDDWEQTLDEIHRRVGHYHCVHAINNACLVVAALIHGRGDFGRTVGIAVMGGLDTDCNGATAGSIFGALHGRAAIDDRWITPFQNTLHTSLAEHPPLHVPTLITRTHALARQTETSSATRST